MLLRQEKGLLCADVMGRGLSRLCGGWDRGLRLKEEPPLVWGSDSLLGTLLSSFQGSPPVILT